MKTSEISRHLHHVRASYNGGVWLVDAHVFDLDNVFLAAVSGCNADLELAVRSCVELAKEHLEDHYEETPNG